MSQSNLFEDEPQTSPVGSSKEKKKSKRDHSTDAPTLSSNAAKKEFEKIFERLAYRYSYGDVFDDFLDFSLYMLTHEKFKKPEQFARLDKKYNKAEGEEFAKLFMQWTIAADNDGEGFYDALGDLFMDLISHGNNGQYFTPQNVCDMMAIMTMGDIATKDAPTICDPAGGSGRMILAAGKMNRNAKCYVADNTDTCCKMSVLNLTINSLRGEVACMNSLSMEHYHGWLIDRVRVEGKFIPFIIPLDRNVTSFKSPENWLFQEDIERIDSERRIKAMLNFMKTMDVAAYEPVKRNFYTVDQQYFAYLQQSRNLA